MYPVRVESTYSVDKAHVEAVISEAEEGIAYWATTAYTDNQEYRVLTTEEADLVLYEDEDATWAHASYQQIADVMADIASGKTRSKYQVQLQSFFLDSVATHTSIRFYAAENIDPEVADHIVQLALFGDILYG